MTIYILIGQEEGYETEPFNYDVGTSKKEMLEEFKRDEAWKDCTITFDIDHNRYFVIGNEHAMYDRYIFWFEEWKI